MATSAPQVAPIASVLIASVETPTDFWIAVEIRSAWSLFSGSVCTRMLFEPEVFTIGEAAASMFADPASSATASRILVTLAWVTWFDGRVTWYSTPPENSMPRLSPRKVRPAIAATRITAEIEYHSHLRPTKSIEILPS